MALVRRALRNDRLPRWACLLLLMFFLSQACMITAVAAEHGLRSSHVEGLRTFLELSSKKKRSSQLLLPAIFEVALEFGSRGHAQLCAARTAKPEL